MLTIVRINRLDDFITGVSRADFAAFLHRHLEEARDSVDEIDQAIDYAFSADSGRGGFLLVALQDGRLAGGLVMNHTGMGGYVPEYLLVYVAVDASVRNAGIGRRLVTTALAECNGAVALHCPADNPARRLYERLGFQVKYMEMRRPAG
jgi:ribosomal-protein-alanine N-acetyltransferase